jgi:hypothetical protein
MGRNLALVDKLAAGAMKKLKEHEDARVKRMALSITSALLHSGNLNTHQVTVNGEVYVLKKGKDAAYGKNSLII